jgi:DNA-binding transcriptional ArsR family regulator
MELTLAVQRLGALAHGTRLSLFRLLVQQGASGLAAGELASRLDLAPSTASFHLAELTRVALIAARREGRSHIYAVDFKAMSELIDYLKENCCSEGDDHEICRRINRRGKASPRKR